MDPADIAHRFTYHRPTPERAAEHDAVRTMVGSLAQELNDRLPEGREKSLAITRLEEATMWANAAIARAAGPQNERSA